MGYPKQPGQDAEAHIRVTQQALAQSREIDSLRAQLAEAERERDKWRRIRTPTHGSCCTCQSCGLNYDDCRCDLDDVVDDLDVARARIVELERLLLWALDEMDALGDDAPPHACEFILNPEKGACDWHEKWGEARAALVAREDGDAT